MEGPLVWLACPAASAASAVVRAKLSAFMDEFRGEMQSMEEQHSFLPTEVDRGVCCRLLFPASASFPLYL